MKSLTRYQQQQRKDGSQHKRVQGQLERTEKRPSKKINSSRARDEGDTIDSIFGFERFKQGSASRTGWLLNYLAISMPDEAGVEKSGLDLYFLDRVGGNFKASIFYEPYFYIDIGTSWNRAVEVSQQLTRRFEGCKVVIVDKQDLDLPNHLSGRTHRLLKISFSTVSELMDTKSALRPLIIENKKRQAIRENYFDGAGDGPIESIADLYSDGSDGEDSPPQKSSHNASLAQSSGGGGDESDPLSCIIDLREYDVPYTMRAAIDTDLRVGAWYSVTPDGGSSSTCSVSWQKELLELCEPKILAFDIECEKSPLKFPNAESDRIYMISYMLKGQGYLIINREIVTEDIEDFEYTPKPHFPGPFQVMNEADEESLLRRFLLHIQELKPHIIVTYNGDRFDWPYVEMRCSKFKDLSLFSHLGIKGKSANGDRSVAAVLSDNEYTGRCIVHMDAFCWVQRDSYLPQGNHGLKAVTKNKLGYDPIEVDPEDMLTFARERPAYMASYSVSDAVATYYLYTTYVHNFIFSLSTIIPMGSEDVLRKGSGTLCEALLMVEAYTGNIICPNKQVDSLEDFHEGHLLENETYIGGHVECLEAGVFRADIPAKFNLVPTALQQLIGNIDRDLTFTLETEHGIQRSDIVNYDEVKQAIVQQLESLRDSPLREENPIIYHLDVGAMYPNIILTNRLQPSAMVSVSDCAACDFNRVENGCKRVMSWTWRGEYSPATYSEYASVRRQLTYEKIVGADNTVKPFSELSPKDQAAQVKTRLKAYSQRVYKKSKVTEVKEKSNTVCMRENSFYVDTVKAFRDRRYDYKLLTKTWKGKKIEAEKKGDALARKVAEDREILMDSLQLAHKCILNSFYGYVMRKGARWRSMEMAGIVTFTGAQLIKQARELVEQVGRPLELDTDGIWCILPSSFPQDFKFKTKSGSSVPIGYPCAMLNADVHERYTNHQYQDLVSTGKKGKTYSTHSECSIFFELDGPYKAMVLPASPEEGRLLKKKYVVFNFNGTIAELKGFELKRRGELELVKIFQSQVFEHFLAGTSLEDCYNAVGAVANQWLDVLDEQGTSMDDQELLELISERKTISKTVEDYEGRKSTSLTTAARLADFLGAEMVKDKGLNCNLIISRLPAGAPVTERALPVAIFSCEPAIKRYFLRKWLKDSSLDCEDFRDVVDWSYYKERLGKTIQKIITIPAGMQAVKNPCPRVIHPDWLQRGINEKAQGKKQMSIQRSMAQMLIASKKSTATQRTKRATDDLGELPGEDSVIDLEDTVHPSVSVKGGLLRGVPVIHQRRPTTAADEEESTALDGDFNPLTFEENLTLEPEKLQLEAAPAEVDSLVPIKPMGVELPQSLTEFNLWLTDRKAMWSRHRKEGKADAQGRFPASGQLSSSSGGVGKKKPMGVMDLVRNAALAASQGFWQIIELQESDTTPGDFTVWAMTAPTQLQRLSVVIPRVIYVNIYPSRGNLTQTEEAAVQLGGVKVRRELPHGHVCRNLYEISLSERKFQRNEHALNMFLCNSQVEGVYEAQVPLWFRGALKMGCVAKVNNSKLKGSGAGGLGSRSFKLQDVDLVNAAAHPYLHPSVAVFKRIFIYCAIDRNRNRSGLGVLGVFIIDSSNVEEINEINKVMTNLTDSRSLRGTHDSGEETGSTDFPLSGKGFVWLINGYGSGSFDTKPPFQKLYRKFQADPVGNVKFFPNSVASSEEAMRQANERLNAYQRERHGPTIVVAQGSYDAKQWRFKIPMLQDFPLATIPANSLDEMLPAVGWQMFVAERMIQRYLIFPRWFSDRLQSARYALVPVCNLGTDALTTILDVVYARQLVHNRHILWISERSNAPDLGGAERDEHMIWSEALVEPVINDSGAYRSICVEMDIFGLAVCSIMCSGELDAEGLTTLAAVSVTDLTEGSKAGSGSLSSDSSSARAFSIFKAVVAKCMDEMSRKAGPNARISDSLLTSVYRYLCGYGNGLLTDPALHRVVYNLMIKLFKKLIGGLVKMGTKVVHANFGRVIIATNKSDLAAAKEYVNFILAAIIEKDIFACLTVDIKAYWEQLIWVGPENWGGIPMDADSDQREHDANASALSAKDMQLPEKDAPTHSDQFRTPNGSAQSNIGKRVGDGEVAEKGALEMLETHAKESASDNRDRGQDEENPKVAVVATTKKSVNFSSDVLGGGGSKKAATLDEILGSTYTDDNEGDENDYDMDDSELMGEEEVEEEEEDLSRKHWNLAKYLPSAAEEYFYYIIGEFMQLYKEKKRELEVDPRMSSPDAIEEELCAYMRHTMTHSFTTKMLSIVDELTRSYLPSSHSLKAPTITGGRTHLDVFPKRAGSHLDMVSPALEFVKSAAFVMSLDPMLKNEVASLKKMLLTQLKVREFSEESAFVDPCLSYVLRDVICNYCSSCRDFDLLRDSSLTGDDEASRWRCEHCFNQIDLEEVENRLVEELEHLTVSYQLQDLRCRKSRIISRRLCSAFSESSCAPLEMDLDEKQARRKLNTLLRVAQFHGFTFLKEYLNDLQIQ